MQKKGFPREQKADTETHLYYREFSLRAIVQWITVEFKVINYVS